MFKVAVIIWKTPGIDFRLDVVGEGYHLDLTTLKAPGPNTTPPMDTYSTPYKSSPPKKVVKAHVAAHDRKGLESLYPDITTTVPASKMLELLRSGVSSKQFPSTPSLKLSSASVDDRHYVQYLNRLSSNVHDTLGT